VKDKPASIGVISDTHGLLRQEAIEALRGSDLIIHAGDIGGPEIIDALESLAPVVAVRGNTDHGRWADSLPETAIAEAGETLIYVLHDIHALDLDPAAAGFRMVVSGHSHKPERSERAAVIYLNPGSAGLGDSSCQSHLRELILGIHRGGSISSTFRAFRGRSESRSPFEASVCPPSS
jgi:putative phosphoesterase